MQRLVIVALTVSVLIVALVLAHAEGEGERKPGPLPGKHTGEATCKKCRFKQDKAWKTTAHAKAHEMLPAKYKDDAACTICHATGLGQPGGVESTAKTLDHGRAARREREALAGRCRELPGMPSNGSDA